MLGAAAGILPLSAADGSLRQLKHLAGSFALEAEAHGERQ